MNDYERMNGLRKVNNNFNHLSEVGKDLAVL